MFTRAVFHSPDFIRQHLARPLAAGLLIVLYALVLLDGFLAPVHFRSQARGTALLPPAKIHVFDAQGRFHWPPFIYRPRLVDPLKMTFVEDATRPYPLKLFAAGEPYRLIGLFPGRIHLIGVAGGEDASPPGLHWLGTDRLGRDVFARLLHGGQVSLLLGPLALLAANLIGVSLGAIAGYIRTWLGSLIVKSAEFMLSVPTIILILILRASFPLEAAPLQIMGMILLILAASGWAEIALLSRGMVLRERASDYVAAAISLGARDRRIVFRHILPNILPALRTQYALDAPGFILAEVTLSFFGIGIQDPEVSWGTMLADALDLSALLDHPWLLAPALAIFLTALAFQFLAEDPRESNAGVA